MKLLKNRRAWLKWKREEIGSQDDVQEPTSFPCYAYATVRSYGYEEQNEHYLYPADITEMNDKIQKAIPKVEA